VGFEPTIPVFKRVKTFHAVDRAVTVIDVPTNTNYKLLTSRHNSFQYEDFGSKSVEGPHGAGDSHCCHPMLVAHVRLFCWLCERNLE
jgi:hypothetical protein